MISIPKNVNQEIQQGMQGDAISLPFFAPYFYWTRGDSNESQSGSGVMHYGGWSASADVIDSNLDAMPGIFTKEVRTGSEGTYEVYASRHLFVAPIAKRQRWEIKDETDKGRSHVQVLAYAATFEKSTRQYQPWMPVILSAKGMATVDFNKVITEWEKATSEVRKEWADGGSSYFFWMTIGTFGERVAKSVGKVQKSFITPPQLYIPFGGNPGAWTPEQFGSLYVGDEIANSMIDYKDAAADWLEAWNDKEKADKANAKVSSAPADLPF